MNAALARFTTRAGELARRLWQAVRRHPWLAVAALPALLVLYVLVLIPFTPSIGDISKARVEKPATVVAHDGKVLATYQRINRDWVKLPAISPPVVQALIATEDRRFYEHNGIDLRRTVAAVLNTLKGETQGGSTITQQLARNLYPEQIGRSVSITRKVREAITALKIEAVYSKDEILESYLNTVPFLYNAHGIEMAARTYFDKGAGKLDVLEAATLIGMLKGTSYYNPVTRPERALQRRNIVLAQMVRDGKLTDAQFDALKKRPLKLDFERQPEALGPAPHLARQLRSFLIEWADRNGYDIFSDGLVVRTTLDFKLQTMAVQAVARQGDALQRLADGQWSPRGGFAPTRPLVRELLRETPQYKAARDAGQNDVQALKTLGADAALLKALREDKARLSAGFLALDPRNGQVRAWVGSRDFIKDQFDHVSQARRQPGSTFKPFVYGAAFEQGMSPADVLMDEPVEIDVGGGQIWRPTDGGEPSYMPMLLRDGLAYSKNTITAQVIQRVGPLRVAALARSMGVRQSKLDVVLSLALGTSPVTLKEMVASYGTIANGGSYIEPFIVTQIEGRNGEVLQAFTPPSPQPALPQPAADRLLDTLRGAIDRGTGTRIRSQFGIQADVAGKTGTTQDNTDGWFILMHPELVAGAWVGFNDSRLTMSDGYGQGARSALPIVGDFFQAALKGKVIDGQARFSAPQESFAAPDPLGAASAPFGLDPNGASPAGWSGGFGPGMPAEAMVGGQPQPQPIPVPAPVAAPVVQPAPTEGVVASPVPAARIIAIPQVPQGGQGAPGPQGTRIIGIPPQTN